MARTKGLTIPITVDLKGFNDNMRNLNKELSGTNRSISSLNRALKLDPGNAELVADRMEKMHKAAELAQKKVDELKKAYDEVGESVKTLQSNIDKGIYKGDDLTKAQEQVKSLSDYQQVLKEQTDKAQASANNLNREYENMQKTGGQTVKETAQAVKDADEAQKKAADSAKAWSDNLEKAADKVNSVGNKLTVGITVPAVAAAKKGIDAFSDYESTLVSAEGIMKRNGVAADDLAGHIEALSSKTGTSSKDIAEGVYNAVSAGAMSQKQALDITKTANELSKVGFTDTATAVELLTKVLNTYGDEAGSVSDIADKLMATQDRGVLTVEDMSAAYARIMPTMKAAGISFDELSGAMAALTAQGMTAEGASTALQGAVSNIIKPTQQAQEAAKTLGINFSAANLSEKGLAGFVQEISDKLKTAAPQYAEAAAEAGKYSATIDSNTETMQKNADTIAELQKQNDELQKSLSSADADTKKTDAYKQNKAQYDENKKQIAALKEQNKTLKSSNSDLNKSLTQTQGKMTTLANATDSPIQAFATLFGSVEGLNGIMTMASEQGMTKLTDYTKEMGTAAGQTADAYADYEKTTAAQTEKLKNDLNLLFIDLGRELVPTLKDAMPTIKGILKEVRELPEPIKKTAIETVGALALVGPGLKLVAGGIKTVSKIPGIANAVTSALAKLPKKSSGSGSALSGASKDLTSVGNFGTQLKQIGTNFVGATATVGVFAEIGLVVKEYAHVAEDISQLDIDETAFQNNLKHTLALATAGAGFTAGLTAIMSKVSDSGHALDALVGEGLAAGLEVEMAAAAQIIGLYADTVQGIANISISDDYEANLDKVSGMIGTAGAFVGGVTTLAAIITGATGGAGGLAILAGEGVTAGIEAELAAAAEITQEYASTVQQINDLTIDDATFNANMDKIKSTITGINLVFTANGVLDFFTAPSQLAGHITDNANIQTIKEFISVMKDLTSVTMPTQEQLDGFLTGMQQIRDMMTNDGSVWESIQNAIAGKFDMSATNSMYKQFKVMLDMINGLSNLSAPGDESLATTWNTVMKAVSDDTKTYMQKTVSTVTKNLNKISSAFSNTKLSLKQSIKVPHFKIKGSWNPANFAAPYVDVSWYKKGGIFNSPSVIGVGEAGSEAVVPIEKLQSMLTAANQQTTTQILSVLTEILAAQQKPVVLDSGALVGGIAGKMDNALGQRAARGRRER